VLGIFVAIIVVLFSGYLTVKNSLPVYSKENQTLTYIVDQTYFAYFLLMGQVLINFIFLFMFLLAKIINKNISVPCNCFLRIEHANIQNTNNKNDYINCLKCNRSCNGLQKIFFKYPYIAFANCIIVLGYFVIWLWWYIDTFLYDYIHEKLLGNFCFVLIPLVVPIFFIGVKLFIKIKKYMKNLLNI